MRHILSFSYTMSFCNVKKVGHTGSSFTSDGSFFQKKNMEYLTPLQKFHFVLCTRRSMRHFFFKSNLDFHDGIIGSVVAIGMRKST